MSPYVRLMLMVACLPLASCASNSQSVYNAIDMIPHWAGGEPPGIPPRPGTPEYQAYVAKRNYDAGQPKVAPQKQE